MGLTLSDISEGITKTAGDIGSGFHKAVGEVVDGVKKTAGDIKKGWRNISKGLGPVGTIALIMAMPYLASWAMSTYATYAAGTATAESLVALEAVSASSAAGSVASGSLTLTEGVSALAAGTGEAAALGGAGASSLYTSAALAETAALPVASTSLGLGATLAPYTPEIGTFEASKALAFETTTGEGALGIKDTSRGFDYKKLAKTLLSGEGAPSYDLPTPSQLPSLTPTERVGALTSATGGGLGFSKFVEEAQPILTGKARQAEEAYKSLLARGF